MTVITAVTVTLITTRECERVCARACVSELASLLMSPSAHDTQDHSRAGSLSPDPTLSITPAGARKDSGWQRPFSKKLDLKKLWFFFLR